MSTIDPRRIVEVLSEREARNASMQNVKIHVAVIGLFLGMVYPLIYVVQHGQLSASSWFDIRLLGAALAASLALGRLERRGSRNACLAWILLDFGMLGAMIAQWAYAGMATAGDQSLASFNVTLFAGFIFTATSAIRLSQRQVWLSGLGCLALIIEATWLDAHLGRQSVNLPYILILVIYALWAAVAAHFSVRKTRALIGEAAYMEAESHRVRDVFSRYVSPQVAEAVLHTDLSKGRRQRVTLLFADIRGFTRISESLPPEEVVDLLNAYFSRMVKVLFAHGGTLDKYMGDGMMAVFGAPVPSQDHAWQAVLTALGMRQELAALNVERAAAGLPVLAIGIGLHTGECVIGNIGADQRLDYTAIGDVVNTASRIEGLTKELGEDVLLSADTLSAADPLREEGQGHPGPRGRVLVRPMPATTIRGKEGTFALYALDGVQQGVPRAAENTVAAETN